MTGTLTYNKKYDFYHYKKDWDAVKEKWKLTEDELHEEVLQALQMYAWADILTEVDGVLQDRKDLEEREK